MKKLLALVIVLAPLALWAAPGYQGPSAGVMGGGGGGGGSFNAIFPDPIRTATIPVAIVDTFQLYSGAPGGLRDDNGSSLSNVSRVVDAATDAIIPADLPSPYDANDGTIVFDADTTGGVSGTVTLPEDADYLLCRDSITFVPCKDTATCVTTLATSRPHALPVVIYDAASNSYWSTAVMAYTTASCTGAFQNDAGVTDLPPFDIDTGVDTISLAMETWHTPTKVLSKAIGSFIAQYPLSARMPIVTKNLVETAQACAGTFESCGSPCLGWTKSGGAFANASKTFPITNITAWSSVLGTACENTGRSANGTVTSPAFTTEAGVGYDARFWVRTGTTGTGNVTYTITVSNSDRLSGWHFVDTWYKDDTTISIVAILGMWKQILVRFRATSTSSAITIQSSSNTVLGIDEVAVWRSDYQGIEETWDVQRLWPILRGYSATVDSGTPTLVYDAIPISVDGDVVAGIDYLQSGLNYSLPKYTPELGYTLKVNDAWLGNIGLRQYWDWSHIKNSILGYPGFVRGAKYSILYMGSKEIHTPGVTLSIPNTGTAVDYGIFLERLAKDIYGLGSLPIWVTPAPFGGDTSDTTNCAVGPVNCGSRWESYRVRLLQSSQFMW